MTTNRYHPAIVCRDHALRTRSHGFTLLEVLVAISIFSFIALGGFRLLNTTAAVTDAGQLAMEKTRAYKRATTLIANDLRNAINRPIPTSDNNKQEHAAFLTQRDLLLEFSRGAYGPSTGAARSNAVRIRYLLREADTPASQGADHNNVFNLIRQVSPMDGDEQGVEREQLLLQNVEIATIRFMDHSDVWHSQWPIPENRIIESAQGADAPVESGVDAIPKAVELDIRTTIPTGPLLVAVRA